MSVIADNIMENYKKAYPSDTFVVHKFTAPGGCGWRHGYQLLRIQLVDNDWLDVYKLIQSSGSVLNSDDIKTKAFAFIYDTKDQTDDEKRRESLYDSLKNVFPNHYVNVFIFTKQWSWNVNNSKGSVSFTDKYGSDVHIVLN